MHQIWFNQTKVPLFWQVIQDAEVHYTRFRMLDIVRIQNFQQIVDEHLCLLQAIEEKREQQIQDILQYHLLGGIRRMAKVLQTDAAPYFNDREDIGSYIEKIEAIAKPTGLAQQPTP